MWCLYETKIKTQTKVTRKYRGCNPVCNRGVSGPGCCNGLPMHERNCINVSCGTGGAHPATRVGALVRAVSTISRDCSGRLRRPRPSTLRCKPFLLGAAIGTGSEWIAGRSCAVTAANLRSRMQVVYGLTSRTLH